LLVERVREFDLEDNKKVTVLVALFVVRHTKVINSFDVIRFNNFTSLVLYSDLSTIKMSKNEVDSSKSLKK
jgi:hypothetical protein